MIKDNSKLKPQEFESHWPRKTPLELRGKQSLNPISFESKWQEYWERMGVYQPDLSNPKNPYYNLMMFPYPSAEGLHVGNMYAFTGADIYGRLKRMQGYDVFEPIGLDGFGIHSENYAIKIGKNPSEQAKISEKNFYRQLRAIGNGFAWENHLETYDPDYYRWTQWIFVKMFKAGLAYRKKSPVNFCPSCKTVLSDEQVIDGACERCKSKIEKRDMEQWYFRITRYADKLLKNIEKLEWTNKVKLGQKNWIGKKEGIVIKYQISNTKFQIECFTTRPDTNFGATFIVIAPEHPFINVILGTQSEAWRTPGSHGDSGLRQNDKLKDVVKKYVERSKKTSEADRIAAGRKKTGVFSGFYAVNQLNGYKMPIYISDFVLGHVGTGAVVGVPGHDLRDFEFAKEFDIPIIRVVVGKDGDKSPIAKPGQVQEEEGTMINSEFLNGMDIHQATIKMMDHLEEKGWGKRVTTYKLRDWCISRQRYWGAPIPMILCASCAEKGIGASIKYIGKQKNLSLTPKYQSLDTESMPGWFPVPEEQLPVLLPKDVKDWRPEGTGKGPLAKIDSFVKTKCPNCGGQADRETDVCDTFLDSSWYHLRYPSISQVSGVRCQVSGVRGQVSGVRCQESGVRCQVSGVRCQVSGVRCQVSGVRCQESGVRCQVSGVRCQESGVKKNNNTDSETYNLKPETYNLKPETYNLKPETYNLKPEVFPWDPQITRKWLPVTQYIGGAEHTVLHLLYARFVAMVFKDLGMIDFEEPYTRFYAHGLIIAEGAKMSKSRGNVVIPDEYINKYGADTLRTYLMFLGPFDMGGDFKDTGIAGMYRFLSRVWRLVNEYLGASIKYLGTENDKSLNTKYKSLNTVRIMHRAIKEVTDDLEGLRYNTAIAHIMEYVNQLTDNRQHITKNNIETLLLLLAPFAPFMTEELWQQLSGVRGQGSVYKTSIPETRNPKPEFHSIHLHPWPSYDPKYLEENEATIIVQINGKTREVIKIASRHARRGSRMDSPEVEESVTAIAKNSEKVKKHLEGKTIRKVIFVPGKLINFVV